MRKEKRKEMNKPNHEEIYKGYHIAIYQEMDPESPAAWGVGDVCGWSRHFTVESKHINKNIFGALMKMDGYDEYAREAGDVRNKFHVFPIDAYVHSGIVLSLHGEGTWDPWDTSDFVGCVLMSKHEAKGKKRAKNLAHAIITAWNHYLNGEVHGYVISRPNKCGHCGHVAYENVESLWGIYGDTSNALAAARETADALKKP
jgi:hypothetical protein